LLGVTDRLAANLTSRGIAGTAVGSGGLAGAVDSASLGVTTAALRDTDTIAGTDLAGPLTSDGDTLIVDVNSTVGAGVAGAAHGGLLRSLVADGGALDVASEGVAGATRLNGVERGALVGAVVVTTGPHTHRGIDTAGSGVRGEGGLTVSGEADTALRLGVTLALGAADHVALAVLNAALGQLNSLALGGTGEDRGTTEVELADGVHRAVDLGNILAVGADPLALLAAALLGGTDISIADLGADLTTHWVAVALHVGVRLVVGAGVGAGNTAGGGIALATLSKVDVGAEVALPALTDSTVDALELHTLAGVGVRDSVGVAARGRGAAGGGGAVNAKGTVAALGDLDVGAVGALPLGTFGTLSADAEFRLAGGRVTGLALGEVHVGAETFNTVDLNLQAVRGGAALDVDLGADEGLDVGGGTVEVLGVDSMSGESGQLATLGVAVSHDRDTIIRNLARAVGIELEGASDDDGARASDAGIADGILSESHREKERDKTEREESSHRA
jgi:hypothetical protein